MKKYLLFFSFCMILFVSCQTKTEQGVSAEDTSSAMQSTNSSSDTSDIHFPTLTFSLNGSSTFFEPQLKDSGIYALKVATAVLNSQEFRDSISRYFFPCKNYGYKCENKCTSCDTDTILTKIIFDSLYREANVVLKLNLNGCGGRTYGETAENSYLISSCYYTVYDDKSIPFTYCYADHICHEYMHNVGFYHYMNARRRIIDKDIAEKTGWLAYYILKRWYKAGIKPL